MPWNIIWEAYLDPGWRKSLSRLNDAFLEWDSLVENPADDPAELMNVEHRMDEAIHLHAENMRRMLSGSILQMYTDSKTGDIFFDIASGVGPLAARGARYVMTKLGILGPSAEAFEWMEVAIPAVSQLVKQAFPSAKTWRTSGQIRRMFREIYDPTK